VHVRLLYTRASVFFLAQLHSVSFFGAINTIITIQYNIHTHTHTRWMLIHRVQRVRRRSSHLLKKYIYYIMILFNKSVSGCLASLYSIHTYKYCSGSRGYTMRGEEIDAAAAEGVSIWHRRFVEIMTFVRNASAAFSRDETSVVYIIIYFYYYYYYYCHRSPDTYLRRRLLLLFFFSAIIIFMLLLSASWWISTKTRTIISRIVHNIIKGGWEWPG